MMESVYQGDKMKFPDIWGVKGNNEVTQIGLYLAAPEKILKKFVRQMGFNEYYDFYSWEHAEDYFTDEEFEESFACLNVSNKSKTEIKNIINAIKNFNKNLKYKYVKIRYSLNYYPDGEKVKL